MLKRTACAIVALSLVGSANAGNPLDMALLPIVAGPSSQGVLAKSQPGTLYGAYVVATAAGYLMVFNSNVAPTAGAVTQGTAAGNLVDCVPITVTNTAMGINYNGLPGETFSQGIYIAYSSTGCGTLTYSATATIHASVN